MIRRAALLLGILLALTACGSQHPAVDADFADPSGLVRDADPVDPSGLVRAEAPEPAAETQPAGFQPRPALDPGHLYEGFTATAQEHPTLVARVRGDTPVYAASGEPEPVRTVPGTTILGTVTVLLATGPPTDGWLEVMLPGRPNGSTGWIAVDAVDLYPVDTRIVIDLSERTLTYYEGDGEVLTTSVAVGSSRYPTPTGTFFVTDSVTVANPNGPWGPAALGLSARSETITEFNGGDGIIGIHGTNKPGSIGNAASLGCVRLPNETITSLHELVPLGTPVEIRA